MMRFKVVTDTHYYGADPCKDEFTVFPDGSTILLGDIVDRKNCLPEDAGNAQVFFVNLISAFKEFYRFGNHECMNDIDTPLVINGIAFMHGDLIMYGYEKHIERRKHDVYNASKFERFYKKSFSKLRNIKDWSEDKLEDPLIQERIMNIAIEHKVKTICIGHCHPKKLVDKTVNGVRILVLPRGLTEIDL